MLMGRTLRCVSLCTRTQWPQAVTDTDAHSIVTAALCATVVFYSVWHSVTVTCFRVYARSGTVTENLLHHGDGRRSV